MLRQDPFSGHLFVFRGKRGDYFKAIYWDGSGMCLFAKRLEKGKFVWPPLVDGGLMLTPAQLALLIEGIDWRRTGDCQEFRVWPGIMGTKETSHGPTQRACDS